MKFEPQTLCEKYLEAMQCECRTLGFLLAPKWTKRDKIDRAKEIALGLGYEVIDDTCSLLIFQKDIRQSAEEQGQVTLLSSHADLSFGIRHPFVSSTMGASSKERFLTGTFDNSITNAVLLSLLHTELPTNTVFALTGDEETGRCFGAKQAIENLKRITGDGISISAFAMDVTWEGKKNSVLTFENFKKGDRELVNVILNMIEDGYPITCVTRRSDFPERIPTQYRSPNEAMFDEGAAYRGLNGVKMACSVCIPTAGPMHSDEGMIIKAKKLEQYKAAMESFLWNLQKSKTYGRESQPPFAY